MEDLVGQGLAGFFEKSTILIIIVVIFNRLGLDIYSVFFVAASSPNF